MSSYFAAIPTHWELSRVDRVCTVNARIGWKALTASEYQPDGYAFLSTPNIKSAEIDFDNVNYISESRYEESPELKLAVGDVLLAKDGKTLGITNIVQHLPRPATVNGSIAVLRSRGVEPRFLRYVLASKTIQDRINAVKDGMDVPHLFQRDINKLPIPLPPPEEQTRIADFLDVRTAQIDQLITIRDRQRSLLDARLTQIIDGATAGEVTALIELGWVESVQDWRPSRVSRLCDIVPGYAFPSEGYVPAEGGVRLLRGINVSVGATDWSEVVAWNLSTNPVPGRFHLRDGDLVLGMDRPWIKDGMRLAFIGPCDLPALLLQRVACLRPKSVVDMRFIRWVLNSSHFRNSIEAELTGVSVPHISADQIGSYLFLLPSAEAQSAIAMALDSQADMTARLKASIDRQLNLLLERRHALITAAVAGQFDMSTASGSDLS